MTKFKSYSEMRRDFYQKYQHKIVPCVKKHEDERQKKLRSAILGSTTTAILGLFILFSIFYFKLDKDATECAFKVALGLFGASYAIWFSTKKDFERKIKAKIMPTVWSESNLCRLF